MNILHKRQLRDNSVDYYKASFRNSINCVYFYFLTVVSILWMFLITNFISYHNSLSQIDILKMCYQLQQCFLEKRIINNFFIGALNSTNTEIKKIIFFILLFFLFYSGIFIYFFFLNKNIISLTSKNNKIQFLWRILFYQNLSLMYVLMLV